MEKLKGDKGGCPFLAYLHGEALPKGPTPLSSYLLFLTEKVPLLYPFY